MDTTPAHTFLFGGIRRATLRLLLQVLVTDKLSLHGLIESSALSVRRLLHLVSFVGKGGLGRT
jgi:hypothetical protein